MESLHPELPGQRNPSWSFRRAKSVFTPSFSNLQTIVYPFTIPLRHPWSLPNSSFTTVSDRRSQNMDLFNLISAPNPTKVKTGTRPRLAYEVPLLTATASRVIDMEDTTAASGSSGTPLALEKSPLDFADEDPPQINNRRVGQKIKCSTDCRMNQSTLGGKSLVPLGLDAGSTFATPVTHDAPTAAKSLSDPDPLSYVKPQPHSELDIAQSSRKTATGIPAGNVATTGVKGLFSAESTESKKSTSLPSMDGSPGGIYQRGLGVTNNCRLDTTNACQDMVAMGSQLRLRFEQEVRLLKKATAKIAKHEQRIQAREEKIKKLDQEIKSLRAVEVEVHGLYNQTKNLETLLEAEVSNLQAQVASEEKIKAAFEEFKKYEDDRVEQRCAKMEACLDKLSVDFDEELYPYMLTAIAGRRWVIGHGLRLAVMKCMSEGLKHGIEHGKAGRDLAAIEAYDPKADSKYVKALQDLKDLKYPLVDQLDGLKDAPIVLIMASLYLESDSGEDAPVFSVVCRTHGIGFAHHARFDGIPVSVPTIAPQGLAILLADAATQTKVDGKEDEPHQRLQRSTSLPPFYNLEYE
nr:hypothetical protein [Tanacetum cinerariifolium]